MKVIFQLVDGTSITGEGSTWREALIAAGLSESDRSKIVSSQEDTSLLSVITERSEEHPLYGMSFEPGKIRPLLRKIVYFAEHQSMLVRAIPKKDKWLHFFGLPPHLTLSFLEYFEHHLTQILQPNHEELLRSFKSRYTARKTATNDHLALLISELEEVMVFNESLVEAIANMHVDISQLKDITMGALLTQKVDIMAPYVNMRKIPEEELLFHFFKSNWLSRQVSMYRNEVSIVRSENPVWEMVFSVLYEWVAYCRAYNFNRISDASDTLRGVFASSAKLPVTMVLSKDSYQYILSPKGYVEDRLERQFDMYGTIGVPSAINLRAAHYKWLRQCVLGHSNIEYLPNGQIVLGKGYLKRVESVVPSEETVEPEQQDKASPTIQFLPSLDSLNLKNDEYVICGSAAAVLYGAKSTNTDIDICISSETVSRLLQEGLIKEGEKDGIHDMYYQSLDGNIDIATPDISIIAPIWGWSDWINNSVVTMGYTFLTKEALTAFYEKLVGHTNAEKHISVFVNLQGREIAHGSSSDSIE